MSWTDWSQPKELQSGESEDLSRHIKELAYFLRADAVGVCKLPPYAVYTHSFADGQPIELNHKYAVGILIDQDSKTAEAFNVMIG